MSRATSTFGAGTVIISEGEIDATIVGQDVTLDVNIESQDLNLDTTMYGTIDGTNMRLIRLDTSTNSLQVIDYAHHEIHSGSHYYVQGFLELDDADTFYMKMVTPDTTKWSHFIFDIKSTGICTTYLDEGATGGMAGGSSVIPLNNNRNSIKTSGMVFTSGVTVATSYTTRIENDKWGAAGFKDSIGGGSGREDEIILKQGTTYQRTFISGADSNIIQFKASWYEHTDKT